MKIVRSGLRKYGQFIRFNLVGILNTLVDFAIFTLLIALHVPEKAAQAFSYGAGTLNSFLMNKYWTFRTQKPLSSGSGETEAQADGHSSFRQAVRFAVLNGGNLVLSVVLLGLFTESWGMAPLAAKALVTVFTMMVNFAGSKLWVFRSATIGKAEAKVSRED